MAIPTKPLEVNLDPNELTLDEMCLFEATGFTMVGFRAFLIAHTNWSGAEIGKLTVKELLAVSGQLKERLDKSVPLTSKPA